MAGFVQIISFKTSRIDEVKALGEKLRASGMGTARRATFCQDRDNENSYVNVVEFDSYESAMENSNRPETQEFAKAMAELCDGAPTFTNLDVQESWD